MSLKITYRRVVDVLGRETDMYIILGVCLLFPPPEVISLFLASADACGAGFFSFYLVPL